MLDLFGLLILALLLPQAHSKRSAEILFAITVFE
jgi:hypothetical protein